MAKPLAASTPKITLRMKISCRPRPPAD